MSERKVRYKEVYLTGEVVDISPYQQDKDYFENDIIKFTMDIETRPNEVFKISFSERIYDDNGNLAKKYEGLQTVLTEYKYRSQHGVGDIVTVGCKIDKQEYYADGKFVEFFNLKGDYCSRKNSKSDTPNIWKAHVLIKSMEEKTGLTGDYLEVRGLTHDYISQQKGAIGTELEFRIHDKDLIEGFKSIYKVGSIGYLNGEVKQLIVQEEVKTGGFGRTIQSRPKLEKWLEILGGDNAYNAIYDDNGFIQEIKTIEDESNPFSPSNIQSMEEKIAEKRQKSKDKDDLKRANSQKVSDSDVPF